MNNSLQKGPLHKLQHGTRFFACTQSCLIQPDLVLCTLYLEIIGRVCMFACFIPLMILSKKLKQKDQGQIKEKITTKVNKIFEEVMMRSSAP